MGSFSIMHWLILLVVLIPLFALYCLPTIIAVVKKHPNVLPIVLINLFLGWSGIAWIGALIWSLMPGTPADGGRNLV